MKRALQAYKKLQSFTLYNSDAIARSDGITILFFKKWAHL